jgi:hypothetical protein
MYNLNMSWWDFGDHAGYSGDKLALYRIGCPFCGEKGNFSTEHHIERKKANSGKVLNYDTLKCGNCANFVQVFWSAEEHPGSRSLHNYLAQPLPKASYTAPEHWPETVRRYWLQAHKSLDSENYDAASVMVGSALQATFRDQKAQGKTLKDETDYLAKKRVLPPIIKEWSNEVRLLRNTSAHPSLDDEPVSSEDVKDAVQFLDFLLKYIYDLPKQINDYRERKVKKE